VDVAIGNSELDRVLKAAQSPDWTLSLDLGGIKAEKDSGVDGMPYVIVAQRGGRGMKVSLYMPGDDVTVEGDVIGELSGNPRDMGRQLRAFLEEADLG
jgi:hypothetical protein